MSQLPEWIPINHVHEKPRREILKLAITWDARFKDLTPDEHIETYARELLEFAGTYLRNLVGNTFTFPDVFDVTISPRPRHGAGGNEIALSYASLKEGANGDEARQDVERSLLIHELVHQYDPESERLAMMVELVYVLEKGRMERLQTLKRIFTENRLESKYQDGLQFIADALEMDTIENFLDHATPGDAERLKSVFVREMREVIKTTQKKNTSTLRVDNAKG